MPSSVTKFHSDWLSLIEISGPFISIPVLTEVFPQGTRGCACGIGAILAGRF